jgi:GNAT superfamily N-acetyltransferase
VIVRRLKADDWEALRALRLRGLAEHPLEFGAGVEDETPWLEARWRQGLSDLRWFGVARDDALIACALLRVPEGRKLRHNGWINAMYCAAEAQGSAAGDALMAAIEAEARMLGVGVLKLYAREGNARAVRFYERHGFVVYGREPASHVVAGVAYNSVEMARPLDLGFDWRGA